MLYRVDPLLTPIRVPSHAVCGPSHAPLPGEFAGELGFVGQPESLIDRRHRLDVFPEALAPGKPISPVYRFRSSTRQVGGAPRSSRSRESRDDLAAERPAAVTCLLALTAESRRSL